MPPKKNCCLKETPGFDTTKAVDTLTRWIGDERIYRSTFDAVAVLDGTPSTTAHGLTFTNITKIYGLMIDDGNIVYPVPYADVNPVTDETIGLSIDATNINTIASGITPLDNTMIVVVEYTVD